MKATGPSAALTAELCRIAVSLDYCVRQLERLYLSDAEGLLLSVPALHVETALSALEELIHETDRLDDRSRLMRLRELRGDDHLSEAA